MAELRAPEQNRLLGQLANMLRTTEGSIAAPEFLPPQLDVMGLVRQLMLPSAETVEKLSYGDPLFRMPTQSNIPITADREYLADVVGMAPIVPAASREATRLTNEAADQLVRAITRNPEATAPGVLEAAGQMLPMSRMISPEVAARALPETKVVDEAGNPRLLYHGTNKDYEKFSESMLGTKTGNPTSRLGYFFSVSPSEASRYAADWGKEGGNVRPVYLDIKNPKRLTYKEMNDISMAMFDDSSSLPVNAWKTKEGQQAIAKSREKGVKKANQMAVDLRERLISEGYDGAVVKIGGQDEYIAFSPEQIRSATSDPQMAGLLDEPAQSVAKVSQDTKIVDESGSPLVVYHGTQRAPEGIKEFRPAESGYAGQESAGLNWFTTDPQEASSYANWVEGAGNPTVYPVYLDIRKPASLDDYNNVVESINKQVKETRSKGKFAEYVDTTTPEIGLYDKRVVKALEDKGFDGIRWTNAEFYGGPTGYPSDAEQVILPFSSKQIKSIFGE